MRTKPLIIFFSVLLFAGCFTVSETPFPSVVQTSIGPEKNLEVLLSGFEATVTTYIPVHGYETVLMSSPCRRHRRHHYTSTVATVTYVPQIDKTTVFFDRATDTLEKCGFNLQAEKPRYKVDVDFSGPFISGSENAASLAWFLFTLLTTDYGVQTWNARMKIYDMSTGKVCLFKDYSQKYEAYVWGPIPLFSPAGASKTGYNAMQSWCLTALTDRAMADATAFLASVAR